MKTFQAIIFASLIAFGSAQITPEQNFLPVSFTVSSAPFDIIATPITPVAPYSQRAYQCNITGDSRFPPFASGTFPLTLAVPVGQRVRVIFANGNLGGSTVTQQGEPGVIVQQGGSPIVQQAGGASPIVQTIGSPVVQQRAPPAAMVVQQSPTIVQQPFPAAPSIPNPPAVVQPSPVVQQSPASPVVQQNPASPVVQQTPAATPARTPAATPAPTPASTPASPIVQQSPASPSPVVQQAPASPSPVVQQAPASPSPVVQQAPASPSPVVQQAPASPSPVVQQAPASSVVQQSGRKLLQDRVPGGPNNGLVEYIALASANSVPGFFAGSTQFGVPYVEFTATEAARGQTASFRGALEVAVVVGGVPQVPFTPNPSLSPECQVNVNFRVA